MAIKICPICNVQCAAASAQCPNCGAALARVSAWQEGPESFAPEQTGLTDLAESRLRWRCGTCATFLVLALAALICAGIGLQLVSWLGTYSVAAPAPTGQAVSSPTVAATNTLLPTLYLPTVTITPRPPPTSTYTPTRPPCLQQVKSGDSLIALVSRCGHRDLEVIELVLERNDLASAELIQVGQQLAIPWPTSTADPLAATVIPSANPGGAGPAADQENAGAGSRFSGAPARTTPTLQAGVQWHRVAAGETIVGIAFRYGTDLKVLSELNPEITFSQCDFGQASGGPSCVVTVFEFQNLRVPAPTPTSTLSPTSSGIATATPTSVVNAPAAYSPPNNQNFSSDELVTLRWVASGTLAAGETWRVIVESLSSGQVNSESTTSLSLLVPAAWKETATGWHGYRWRVQLVRESGVPVETEARTFLWETRA